MLLKNKCAIVTGCNRGIGKAILEAFAENGADVFACVRKKNSTFLEYISFLSDKYSVAIYPVYFDSRNTEEIKTAFKLITSSKKNIDVLVNNAGITYNSLFQMTTLDKLKEVFDINFNAPFLLTQYVSKLMKKQKSGSIINISSTAGIDASSGLSVYGASKAAIISLTKAIATELGEFNIRVNSIAPGMTQTDMLLSLSENAILSKLRTNCIKRIGKPHEIANAVVFLASDFSTYITGQVIRVDGGLK